MSRALGTSVIIAGLLSFPAAACDPEDLWREMRSICAISIEQGESFLTASTHRLNEDDIRTVQHQLMRATKLCDDNHIEDGVKLATRVVRFLGHAEARANVPAERLAATGDAPTRLAAK